MVVLKDFEVKVALKSTDGNSPGDALKEYQDPKPSTSSDEWLAERYIEAKTGAEFQIEVYIKPSFKFFAADSLEVWLKIDSDTVNVSRHYSKEEIIANQEDGRPIIRHDVRSFNGSEHSRVTFAFGALSADESIDINSDLATEQAEKMGRIDVTIDRMQSKKLKRPKKSSTGRAHNPLASTAYAKDIVKDKHIRHAMITGSTTPSSAPTTKSYTSYKQYKKNKCQPARFIFRYRDELGLKLLGCITEHQNPIPNRTSTTMHGDRTGHQTTFKEKVPGSKQDEIAKLQAENERLRNRDDENQEFKRKFDQMAQGFAVMKQMNEQLATMFGNFSNSASSSSMITNSATMTGDTGGNSYLPSVVSGVKSDQSLKGIKEEEGAVKVESDGSGRHAAKRQKTVIELD